MGQEFHVVLCFSCQSFQVQQVKKVNRWICKMCGHKQSLLKEFGRGSGADCRHHVQKLNAMKGAKMEEQECNTWSLWEQVEADREDGPEEQDDNQVTQTQVSCWSKYLDTAEKAEPKKEEEEDVLMDRQLHGNQMIDRQRKRRGGQTDGEQEGWTPEQTKRPTTTTSLNWSSPPHVSTRPVSRWAQFYSTDGQVKGGKEPSGSGWSQTVGNITCQTLPLSRPRPSLPFSSMFQSGEEFDFNDDFLSAE